MGCFMHDKEFREIESTLYRKYVILGMARQLGTIGLISVVRGTGIFGIIFSPVNQHVHVTGSGKQCRG
jgi:hypothetical protein